MRILVALLIYIAATECSQACSPPTGPPLWLRDDVIASDRDRQRPPRLLVISEFRYRPAIRKPNEPKACDDLAWFIVRVQLDPSSTASLDDYGYQFRVRSKNAHSKSLYFGKYPYKAKIVNGVGEFEFSVLDVGQMQESAIDLDIEVRAVGRNRQGPKSKFHLRAEPIVSPDGV
jgi:hypothetical protein